MESVSYKKLWDHLEASKKRPTRCRKLIAVDYEDFAYDVKKLDPIFMDNIVNSLFEGDFYILKEPLFISPIPVGMLTSPTGPRVMGPPIKAINKLTKKEKSLIAISKF